MTQIQLSKKLQKAFPDTLTSVEHTLDCYPGKPVQHKWRGYIGSRDDGRCAGFSEVYDKPSDLALWVDRQIS